MRWLAALLALAGPAQADLALSFPGQASETFREVEEFASYKLPIGPYSDGFLQTLVAEGQQITQAWRVDVSGGTTLRVMDSLRQQVEQAGFEILYECETRECGGFDFRFNTEILPEPTIHVDLGDFRYLGAQRLGSAVPEYLSLFVSRGSDTAFVQMILVGNAGEAPVATGPTTPTIQPIQSFGDLVETLLERGAAVLEDLDFPTGSSDLGPGEFSSLQQLASYLQANPEARVALVGHTDAQGSIEGNLELSRRRARSVANRLIKEFGIPDAQVFAAGVGYLAPRASNQTEDGRTKNRRVEVILTSTPS